MSSANQAERALWLSEHVTDYVMNYPCITMLHDEDATAYLLKFNDAIATYNPGIINRDRSQ